MSTPPPNLDPFRSPGPDRPADAANASTGAWTAPAGRRDAAPVWPAAPAGDRSGPSWPAATGGGSGPSWVTPPPEEPTGRPLLTRWWFLALLAVLILGVGYLVVTAVRSADPDPATPTGASTAEPAGTPPDAGTSPADPNRVDGWTPAAQDVLWTFSGTGSETVPIDAFDEPMVFHASHEGSGTFLATGLGPDGDRRAPLAHLWGPGSTLGLLNDGYVASAVEVEAEGPWTIEVASPASAPAWDPQAGIDGTGPAVLRIEGAVTEPTTVRITHDGDSNVVVGAAGARTSSSLLVNEIGAFDGPVVLPTGSRILTVDASGGWTVAREPQAATNPGGGSTRSVSGQGYAVVTLEPFDEPVVATITFEGEDTFDATSLDGNGLPVGLLATSFGPYAGVVPLNVDGTPAALQVRATEPWSIEFSPLAAVPAWDGTSALGGEDDTVVRIDPALAEPALYTVSTESGFFSLDGYDTEFATTRLYRSEDDVEGLAAGTVVVAVNADGQWTLAPR